MKSPLTAGGSGDAEISTVTGCEEGGLRVAVTIATPPFSPMEEGLRSSATAGAPSSSVMASVRLEGAVTSRPGGGG